MGLHGEGESVDKEEEEEVLTVLDEDVLGVSVESVLQVFLVAAHHVGAEDLLVVGLCQVGSGLPEVSLQQAAAALLERSRRRTWRQHLRQGGISKG